MNPTNLDAFAKEVQQLVIAPMTLQNDEVVVVTINKENPEWIDITLNELFHYLYGVYKETMMK